MGERTRELTVLIFGDVGVFILSLWLTLLLRYLTIPSFELFSAHLGPFIILAFVCLFVFYIAGFYDKLFRNF